MITAIIWSLLSVCALTLNALGLRAAIGDKRLLLSGDGGNGSRERRTLVANSHIYEEIVMCWLQFCFLVAGLLRIWLGNPSTDKAMIYRSVTGLLFFSGQVSLVWLSIHKRRYRQRLIEAKIRMLRESAVRQGM